MPPQKGIDAGWLHCKGAWSKTAIRESAPQKVRKEYLKELRNIQHCQKFPRGP